MEAIRLPDHFSYSSLSMFMECPGAWRDRYILHRPEEESDALVFGRLFHELTAAYDLHCIQKRVPTDKSHAQEIFDSVMASYSPGYQYRSLRDLFMQYVDRHVVDLQRLAAVEMDCKVSLGDHFLVGRIDRVFQENGQITVRDLKTDNQIRSQSEIDKDFQLSVYALLAAQRFGVSEVAVEIEFVRYGTIRKSMRSADDIEATRAQLDHVISEIRSAKEFPYRIGSRCSICGYARTCAELRAVVDMKDVPLITTPEMAQTTAQRLIALEQQLDQVKSALKAWCSKHGNVVVNGMEVGFHLTQSWKYPVRPTAEILEARGHDPLDYLAVSATAIKKLVAKDQELEAALSGVREDASYTSFKAKRIKG